MAKQAVAAKEDTRELALPERNPFESYGQSLTLSNITGRLLKFNKGDWLAGEEEEELDHGTRLVANMENLLIGWQKWEDNRPTERLMGFLHEEFKPPKRDALGELDKDRWEVGTDGKARDPYQFSNLLVMKTPGKKAVTDELYTFATSSNGGLKCIGALCLEYGQAIREGHKDDYPIVELGSDAYDHPNKEFGRIKKPTLKIVGWEKKSVFQNDATAAKKKR